MSSVHIAIPNHLCVFCKCLAERSDNIMKGFLLLFCVLISSSVARPTMRDNGIAELQKRSGDYFESSSMYDGSCRCVGTTGLPHPTQPCSGTCNESTLQNVARNAVEMAAYVVIPDYVAPAVLDCARVGVARAQEVLRDCHRHYFDTDEAEDVEGHSGSESQDDNITNIGSPTRRTDKARKHRSRKAKVNLQAPQAQQMQASHNKGNKHGTSRSFTMPDVASMSLQDTRRRSGASSRSHFDKG